MEHVLTLVRLNVFQATLRAAVVAATTPNISPLFTILADSLDEARQKFHNAGHPDSDALFIIKTETEIYLA